MSAIILRNDECMNLILEYGADLEVKSGEFDDLYFSKSFQIIHQKEKYLSSQKAEYYYTLPRPAWGRILYPHIFENDKKLEWEKIVSWHTGTKKKFLKIYRDTNPKNASKEYKPLQRVHI